MWSYFHLWLVNIFLLLPSAPLGTADLRLQGLAVSAQQPRYKHGPLLLSQPEPTEAQPVTIVFSTLSPDARQRLAEAKSYYRKAVDHDVYAREQAVTILTQLVAAYPDDALIRAYLGSVRILEARDTWLIWRKYRLSQEGLRLLDTAVALTPEDLEVRFIRGVTTYHLPDAAQRSEQAAADLQWVAQHAAVAVDRKELDPAVAATALYYHGLCRAAHADLAGARAAWYSAHQLAPFSAAARSAVRHLQETGGFEVERTE